MSNDIFKHVAIQGDGDVGGSNTTPASSQPTDSASGGSGGGTGAGPGAGATVPMVKFGDISSDRVYRTVNKRNKMSYTVVNPNVTLVDATWLYRNSTTREWNEIAQAVYGPKANGAAPAFEPFLSLTYSEANFALDWFTVNDLGSRLLSSSMLLKVGWKTNELNGSTTSGLFSVIDNSGNVEEHADQLNQALTKEITSDPKLGTGVETTSTGSSGPQRTGDGAGGGLSPGGTDSPEASGSPISVGSGNKSKGGLSTGAKAGIGVGAALGVLLIIGLIAFFLLRRRRQKKELGSGYKTQPSSNTYMVDKETQGRVTESPTSPYSDENQQRVPLTDIETAREAPATQAPYEDAPPRSSLGSHSEHERGTGTETSQSRPTNVAHLVEDGMTAEEIRRLEEEERQLDDEIERAARR